MATPASISLGLRNHLLSFGSLKNGLQGGVVRVFAGAAPANADAAQTGTLLATMSELGAAWVPEVISFGSVTLTGGAAGQVTQVSVNGVNLLAVAVPFNLSLFQTAIDLAAAINSNVTLPLYQARVADRTVSIYAMPGTGVQPNGYVIGVTMVTITASTVNLAGGVSSVNGLKLAFGAAGVVSKISSQVVRGAVVAPGGTAAYWRIYTESGDTGVADISGRYRRAQGLIAVVNETMTMPSLSLVANSVHKINTLQVQL